jgi:hypothetical protein
MSVLQAQPVICLWLSQHAQQVRTNLLGTHLWRVLQLEMILQAQEYEAEQDIDLQDFFNSTKGRFTTPLGQSWAKEIVKRRADKQDAAHAKRNHGSSGIA